MHTFKPRLLPLVGFSFGKRRSRESLPLTRPPLPRKGAAGSDGDGLVEFAEIGENAVEGRSTFSEDDALVLRGSREEFVEGSRLREEDEIMPYPLRIKPILGVGSLVNIALAEFAAMSFVQYPSLGLRIQLCHLERRFAVAIPS